MGITAEVRITLRSGRDGLPGAIGQGCIQLLEGVDREHSLNRAAKGLHMAYSKAWRIVREAEAHAGCELIHRDGARGSNLTDAGRRVVEGYRSLEAEATSAVARKAPGLFDGLGA